MQTSVAGGLSCLSQISYTIRQVPTDIFSAPQLVGYVAFVFGVLSFLQKRDDRMKVINSFQVCAYALHFFLLHHPSAAASNCIGLARNILSLKTKTKWLALPLVLATGILASFTVRSWADMIPVISTLLSIYGMFWLAGVPFRLCMLACTGLWLVNNLLAHSYGGFALEATIATANTYTIWRLQNDSLHAEKLQATVD